MHDTAETAQADKQHDFRFSIGTLLLLTAITCLTVNAVVTSRRVGKMEQELESQNRELSAARPMPPQEIARQFEKSTTLGPIAATVKDVRYSAESDSYKIAFSWTDSTTKKTWHTDIILVSDGYGTYYGQILNEPFIKPLGLKDSFPVAVKTPSSLGK